MSDEASEWASIAEQNATLLTSALAKLAAAERERDEAIVLQDSLRGRLAEAERDNATLRAELVEQAAANLAMHLELERTRPVVEAAIALAKPMSTAIQPASGGLNDLRAAVASASGGEAGGEG